MSLLWNTEKIHPRPVTFEYPKVVGYFSLNKQREYSPNLSSLKYLKCYPTDRVFMNLNVGIEEYVKPGFNPKDERLMHLLQFIIEHFGALRLHEYKRKALKCDYVCFRGLLTKIMVTPVFNEDWVVCAINFMGNVYLCEYTEEKKDYEDQEKFLYWGRKFETYVLSDSPSAVPGIQYSNVLHDELCVMFHSRLNQKQILFGAEIDGVANNYPLSADTFCTDAKFVEVKTHRHITTEGHDNIFKKKALRWYCQSYLVGIEDLYVGFRNQSGIVGNIAVYKVPGLPVICAGQWDRYECLKFLDEFLNLVGRTAEHIDNHRVVWKYSYNSKDKQVTGERIETPSMYQFIPDYYADFVRRAMRNT